MIFSKINGISKKGKILVAPLDWGLGHATRCIPVIRTLLDNGLQVIVAADGMAKKLLQQEFPEIDFIHLPGYNILYSRNKYWLPLKITLQVPKILFRIFKEHYSLKKIVKEHSIDAVISDNRFGLYHPGIPCVYITHQLLIKTGNRFSEKIAQKIHYWFIKKYTQCWVPDNGGIYNVAGALSHPVHLPPNVHYIGCISRFEKKETVEKIYDLLVLISGPEPQRTIFENLLLNQLTDYNGRILFVRGLPGSETSVIDITGNKNGLIIKNHLTANELNNAILKSEIVICRSGYTSIMDLVKLQQKAILVPTPGQTEQEYLAAHLLMQKTFYSTAQENFSLTEALAAASQASFTIPSFDMESYKVQIAQFIQSLQDHHASLG